MIIQFIAKVVRKIVSNLGTICSKIKHSLFDRIDVIIQDLKIQVQVDRFNRIDWTGFVRNIKNLKKQADRFYYSYRLYLFVDFSLPLYYLVLLRRVVKKFLYLFLVNTLAYRSMYYPRWVYDLCLQIDKIENFTFHFLFLFIIVCIVRRIKKDGNRMIDIILFLLALLVLYNYFM